MHVSELDTHVSELDTHVSGLEMHVSELDTHVSELGTHVSERDTHVPEPGTHVSERDTHVSEPGMHVSEPATHVSGTEFSCRSMEDGHFRGEILRFGPLFSCGEPQWCGSALFHLAECQSELVLELGDLGPFPWLDEGEGGAFFPGPRRPPAAVGVILHLLG